MYLSDPLFDIVNAVGAPISGAKARFYLTGTTNNATTYSDSALTTPNTNPVIADSAGRFPPIYLNPDVTYRLQVLDASDVLIVDRDPIYTAGDGTASDSWTVLTDIPALRLRTTAATEPELIQLSYNWTEGDGGGVFYYDASDTTTADNGGTVIVDAAGNRWKRQFTELNLRFWNVKNDGTTVNYAAFVAAINFASASGYTLFAPAGRYRLNVANGSATLENVIIQGEAVLDGAGYGTPHTDRGTVFEIIGTSASPFIMRRGGGFVGCQFYYPDQTNTATPTTYAATIDFDFSAGPVQFVKIEYCACFNAFDFISIDDVAGAVGHVTIKNNWIFAYRNDIAIYNNVEHISIIDNSFTWGFWTDATAAAAGKYKRENGAHILYLDGDGLDVRGNLFYGAKWGLKNNGAAVVLCTINDNNFDQVLNCIVFESPSGSGSQTTISGNTFLAISTADSTLSGYAVRINNTSAEDKLVIAGNYFGQTSNDHVSIDGTSAGIIESTGNVYELAGYLKASGSYASLSINAANKQIVSTGDSFLGGGTAYVNGVNCAAAGLLKLVGPTFKNLQAAVSVSGATTYQVANATSISTVGATSNIVAGVTGSAVETHCVWDKPAFVSTLPAFAAGVGTKTFNSGSATDVTGWSETFDNGANFNPTTGVFTAPQPGRYEFMWQLLHDDTITAADRWTFTLAASAGPSPIVSYRAPAAEYNTVSGSALLSLAAGATVKLTVTRNSGSGNFVLADDAAANRFCGNLL